MSEIPKTETKAVEVIGPELSTVIHEHEQSGWRTAAIVCLGASDYRVEFVRPVEVQSELPARAKG